jgi:hypothetical protein
MRTVILVAVVLSGLACQREEPPRRDGRARAPTLRELLIERAQSGGHADVVIKGDRLVFRQLGGCTTLAVVNALDQLGGDVRAVGLKGLACTDGGMTAWADFKPGGAPQEYVVGHRGRKDAH